MSGPARIPGRTPWLEGGALALLVLAVFLLGGEAVRVSYHGTLHATVGEAVLRGGFTTDNPYHAGESLRYYLLHPGLGAALGRTGIGPFWGFALLNLIGALLFAPALDSLGRSLGLGWRARRFSFLAAILAFNGLGWVMGLFGEPLGERPPLLALSHATGTGMDWAWDARLQAFLPKFLNPSSFALALPFGIWLLAHAANPLAKARQAIFPAALALALNPMVGLFCGGVAAIWKAPQLLQDRGGSRWAWPCAGALGVLLALPFLWPLLGESPNGPSLLGGFAFSGTPLSNFLGPLSFLLLAACLAVRIASNRMRWMVGVGVGCAFLGLLAGPLPWGNEYKFSRLAGLLLALPAGLFLSDLRCRGKSWPAWGVLGLTLPTLGMTLAAYLSWDTCPDGLAPRWKVINGRLTAPGSQVFQVESELPSEFPILVLGDPGGRLRQGISITGNPLAPLLHRSLLVDDPHIHNARIPGLKERLQDRERVRQGDAAALTRLRNIQSRQSLLVLTDSGGSETPVLIAAQGKVLAEEGLITLWLLPPKEG